MNYKRRGMQKTLMCRLWIKYNSVEKNSPRDTRGKGVSRKSISSMHPHDQVKNMWKKLFVAWSEKNKLWLWQAFRPEGIDNYTLLMKYLPRYRKIHSQFQFFATMLLLMEFYFLFRVPWFKCLRIAHFRLPKIRQC